MFKNISKIRITMRNYLSHAYMVMIACIINHSSAKIWIMQIETRAFFSTQLPNNNNSFNLWGYNWFIITILLTSKFQPLKMIQTNTKMKLLNIYNKIKTVICKTVLSGQLIYQIKWRIYALRKTKLLPWFKQNKSNLTRDMRNVTRLITIESGHVLNKGPANENRHHHQNQN